MNGNMHDRCTDNDYRELFASSATQLHWLCYTLTADRELSEKVLNAALEQSLKGAGQVFREWMVSWARRLIIRVCIATVRPTSLGAPQCQCGQHESEADLAVFGSPELLLSLPADVLQDNLLRLDPLSRFVFVLRALEGYSRHETALLLNIDDRACEWTYMQAGRFMNIQLISSMGETPDARAMNVYQVAV
jgi:DNA-directed RNA polymerase specialized sigma subunit, sigma24 homolog